MKENSPNKTPKTPKEKVFFRSAVHIDRDQASGNLINKNDIKISEPRHRVAPLPASSGISFRELPKPSLLQLRKICSHYEEKAAGKYSSNSLAGRYLYQMSREVISQLDKLEGDLSSKLRRINLLEMLTKDWEVVFGRIDEDSAVTPRQIAENLAALKEKVVSLTSELERSESARIEESSQFTSTIDEHHRASRERYHNEIDRLKKIHEENIQNLKDSFENEKIKIHNQHKLEIEAVINKELNEKTIMIKDYEQKIIKNENNHALKETKLSKKILSLEASMQNSISSSNNALKEMYENQINGLKREMLLQATHIEERQKEMDVTYKLSMETTLEKEKKKLNFDNQELSRLKETNDLLMKRNNELNNLVSILQKLTEGAKDQTKENGSIEIRVVPNFKPTFTDKSNLYKI